MNELDKWSAEAVGAETTTYVAYDSFDFPAFNYEGDLYKFEWTLSDARCMEMFEERFKLNTYYLFNSEVWVCELSTKTQIILQEEADTPKAARLACAQAIMEASNE